MPRGGQGVGWWRKAGKTHRNCGAAVAKVRHRMELHSNMMGPQLEKLPTQWQRC